LHPESWNSLSLFEFVRDAVLPQEPPAVHSAIRDPDRLDALVPLLRARLPDDLELSDSALLASLAAIARTRSRADRWRAAFNSEIGRRLAARGTDLNTALNIILGLVPAPRG
jgi:hypothetical protein